MSRPALSAAKPLTHNAPGHPDRRLAWIRILLIVLTLAAYARLCTAEFTNWDDPHTIYQNPHFDPPSVEHIAWFWTHSFMDIYTPLTFTIWGALMPLAHLNSPNEMGLVINSWIYHTVNVLLHIAATLAAFELLRRLTKHAGASAIGALLFALHPVQVEPVGWVSGMKDVLYGTLAIVALWQYVEFVQKTQAGDEHPRIHYVIASAAFLAALLSKPTAVVTPVLALIIDWWLLRRDWKKSLKALWPWFIAALIIAVIAKLSQPALDKGAGPVWFRPVVAADALAFYLYKLVYPVHLAMDYGRRPIFLFHSPQRFWTWIAPAAVAIVIWIFRKRARWLVAAGLLFLVCLLPVLGLAPFDFQYYSTVADHYLYLAMIAPALVTASLLARWWKPAPVALSCIILVALGARTWAQTAYWQNTVALFDHTLAINPRSGVSRERLGAHYNDLGIITSKLVDSFNSAAANFDRLGRKAEAKQALAEADRQKAVALRYWHEAETQYGLALKENPDWPVVRLNLSGALANSRKWDQAMAQLRAVIAMQPRLPPGLRGGFETHWFNRGMDAYETGHDREAAEDFRLALKDQPGDAVSNRALQIMEGKMREAAPPPTTRK